jgi:hypothetical protein
MRDVDMRRSRSFRPAVRGALAVVMALVAVSSVWQVASATTTPAAASAARGHLTARHHHVVATEADTMRSVTLRRGDTLTVALHGGWSPPRSSDPTVLHGPAATPALVCPPTATCASPGATTTVTFTAASAGSATVSSTRTLHCPPGTMCPMSVQLYRLDVTVTR